MATALAAKNIRDLVFEWEGKDKNGKIVRGEMRAGGEAMVSASLRRQGILTTKVKKRRMSGGKAIKQKDIAVFTRQLAAQAKPCARLGTMGGLRAATRCIAQSLWRPVKSAGGPCGATCAARCAGGQ